MQGDEIAVLIGRVALGDRSAFSALYQATSPKLFAICIRILKDRADAEEALQEIYVRIWQRAHSFASRAGHALAWLATIARNHCIDLIRARKPVSDDIDTVLDLEDQSTPDPEMQIAMRDEGRRIDRCMEELRPDQAAAVRRAYVEGMSYAELAEEMNAPLNTVRTWLRRSLLKLRECMER